MNDAEVFLAGLFVLVAGLNVVAQRLAVPYPIVLVLGGLAVGAIPGIPDITLNPDLVLVIFLPPLLYGAGVFADLRAIRDNLRPILLLSIGLVLVTTVAVAVVAHAVIGLSWALAFALGAIVSPTDPTAATAIMRDLGVPRRMVSVIEGESLVNDASALVVYRVAVSAAVGGSFSASHAAFELLGAVVGGVAIGVAVGYLLVAIRRHIDDTTTQLTISLLSGYAAFVPAAALGVSGVLAVVSAGLLIGWHAPALITPQTRLESNAMWRILIFLLNATLFMLIGLQLPLILDGVASRGAGELAGYAALACATVIGTRVIWGFTVVYIVRALDRRPQQRLRRSSWRMRIVSSWSGMRGAVSLAAALALPLETDAGVPLPDRDLILFITFALILVTIVGQGLTLPWLIRRLGVRDDGSEEAREEIRARLVAAEAALRCLDEVEGEGWAREDTLERMRGLYRFRQRRFKVRAGKIEDEDGIEDRSLAYQRLIHVVSTAQREAVVQLRNSGDISSDVMHRLERELDLEESRLEI
ncbi:MAG: monovalent cation/hydrogen antiporter [Thermoleophilaceae bacterium]|nr:monovalent cation/hydrogen antiporter [Thermoleophilaceae bacterium]